MHRLTTLVAFAVLTGAALAAQAPGWSPGAQFLSPQHQLNLCLGTTDTPTNGTELFLVPCNTTLTFWGAWDVHDGDNTGGIKLSGTNFCLDAGVNPHDGGPSKLWTCVTVPQQRWFYTADLHIAITGGSQCLDSTGQGCGLGGCAPGTIHCGTGPTDNQVWYTSPVTSVGAGVQIHPGNDKTRCLSPQVPGFVNGVRMTVMPCIAPGQPHAEIQLWDIVKGNGPVRAQGTEFCVDAGSAPANGIFLKSWDCFPGLFQQTWAFTGDNHIAIVGSNPGLCFDLRKEDNLTVQSWACAAGNPQQLWSFSAPTASGV